MPTAEQEQETIRLTNTTQEAIKSKSFDSLVLAEKQTRQANDQANNTLILVSIVELFPSSICDNLSLFSKKHGFLKHAVQVMVQKAIQLLDSVKDKMALIDTIRTVTAGKVFIFNLDLCRG